MANLRLVWCSIILVCFVVAPSKGAEFNLDRSTAELVRSRGFIAIEHHVTIKNGNVLKLVQVLNPLINRGKRGLKEKDVILMFPGTMNDGRYFIANSIGAKPVNYSKLNAGRMNLDKLIALLRCDPSSNSIAFLASNFGHEVWLVNRRGIDESVKLSSPFNIPEPLKGFDKKSQKINLLLNKANPNYWSYSLDEQALIDLPRIIDYVRKKTKRSKITYLCHSTGCSLMLMQLSTNVKFANKLSKLVLWSPFFFSSRLPTTKLFKPSPSSFSGPISAQKSIRKPWADLCSNGWSYSQTCTGKINAIYGRGSNQQDVKPEYLYIFFNDVGSHEVSHLIQTERFGQLRAYDHGIPFTNLKIYGQLIPPPYNVSKITLKTISVWAGETDSLVRLESVKRLVSAIRAPVEEHYYRLPRIFFNHVSHITHKDIARLEIIPCLKTIEK